MALVVGAGLRNEVALLPQDKERYAQGRFEGAVIMWYQDPLEVLEMGVDPSRSIVRLPDSEFTDWLSGGRKYLAGFREYAEECLKCVERFYPHGFRRFQLDNEPNLVWPRYNRDWPGGDGLPCTEWDWSLVMADALEVILRDLPAGVQLGFTPFSHPSQHPEWMRQGLLRSLHDPRTGEMIALLDACEWAAAHCYWQAPGDMGADWAGAEWEYVHRETGLAVVITEAGNSASREEQPPSAAEVEALQAQQYPRYIESLRGKEGVEGLYFYILGHNGDWDGFDLSERICAAIGARAEDGGQIVEGVTLPEWITDIVAELPHAYPQNEEYRDKAACTAIVVHYDAVSVPSGFYAPLERYRSEAEEHISRNWNEKGKEYIHGFGLMYHIKISSDGRVWLTQPFELVTWHAHAANPYAIAVCCDLGPNQKPSDAQLASLERTLDWLRGEFNIMRTRVVGHCEVPGNPTQCPGRLLKSVQAYREYEEVAPVEWVRDEATQVIVAGGFLKYWREHPYLGHALLLEREDTLEDNEVWVVQLFERGLLQWRTGYPVMEARIGWMWGREKGLLPQ